MDGGKGAWGGKVECIGGGVKYLAVFGGKGACVVEGGG